MKGWVWSQAERRPWWASAQSEAQPRVKRQKIATTTRQNLHDRDDATVTITVENLNGDSFDAEFPAETATIWLLKEHIAQNHWGYQPSCQIILTPGGDSPLENQEKLCNCGQKFVCVARMKPERWEKWGDGLSSDKDYLDLSYDQRSTCEFLGVGSKRAKSNQYWEVELRAGSSLYGLSNLYVGLVRRDGVSFSKGQHRSKNAIFLDVSNGCVLSFGKKRGNGEQPLKVGDRVGIMALENEPGKRRKTTNSLTVRFFRNGKRIGSQIESVSTAGELVLGVQIRWKGQAVRILPDATCPDDVPEGKQ